MGGYVRLDNVSYYAIDSNLDGSIIDGSGPDIQEAEMRASLIELGSSVDNQRGLIARTVEAYPPVWIVVHETLQNSIDAIQRSGNTTGSVQIHLNLDNQKVRIRDSGTGFPFKLNYLGLGGTDKSSVDWGLGGNIGVGLTVVILSTNQFKLDTVVNNQKWQCQVSNAYKYLIGELNFPFCLTIQ